MKKLFVSEKTQNSCSYNSSSLVMLIIFQTKMLCGLGVRHQYKNVVLSRGSKNAKCWNLRSLSGDLITDSALIKLKPKRSFKVDLNIYCKSYLELQMVKLWLLKQKVNFKIGFMLFIKKPMPHQILSQVSELVNRGGKSCIYKIGIETSKRPGGARSLSAGQLVQIRSNL